MDPKGETYYCHACRAEVYCDTHEHVEPTSWASLNDEANEQMIEGAGY